MYYRIQLDPSTMGLLRYAIGRALSVKSPMAGYNRVAVEALDAALAAVEPTWQAGCTMVRALSLDDSKAIAEYGM